MFANTHELMLYIRDYLKAAGFAVKAGDDMWTNTEPFERSGAAWLGDLISWKPNWHGQSMLNGLRLDFDVVHRSNATKENTSVDVKVIIWDNSCGFIIYKERVNIHMGETAVKRRLYRVTEFYAAEASRGTYGQRED